MRLESIAASRVKSEWTINDLIKYIKLQNYSNVFSLHFIRKDSKFVLTLWEEMTGWTWI